MRIPNILISWFLLAAVCLTLLSACDSSGASVQVGYQPPFLPVIFAINSDGTVSVTADAQITTPIGNFNVEAGGYPVQSGATPEPTKLTVIIRHITNRQAQDSVWTITTNDEEVSVTTDGHTQITVTSHRVFIDATKSRIRQIAVKDIRPITYSLGDDSHYGTALAWSPDGQYIAVTDTNEIQIFTALTAQQQSVFTAGSAFDPVYISWSRDGNYIAADSTDHQIYIFDISTGNPILKFPDNTTDSDSALSLGFSPNGALIAESFVDQDENSTFEVFDAHTGELRVTKPYASFNILCAWSPNSAQLTTFTDNGVQIWDALTGRVRYTFPRETGVPCFSPNGQRIATVNDNPNVVRVFDAHTDAHAVSFPGHGNYELAWSPDGTRIVSLNTANDQKQSGPTAEIWNALNGGTIVTYQDPYKTFQYQGKSYTYAITDAEWSPNGQYVALVFGNAVDVQTGAP